ncbi:hypothetical protein GCM10009738_83870 [Kitasatospora viridis]
MLWALTRQVVRAVAPTTSIAIVRVVTERRVPAVAGEVPMELLWGMEGRADAGGRPGHPIVWRAYVSIVISDS